jgi:hypothetical protein
MDDASVLLPPASHKTRRGETFEIGLKKKHLSDAHTYWLYFVDAKHDQWGHQRFHIFVTKQAFPDEGLADRLVQTLGLEAAKARLEEATAQGRPLYFPSMHEGWGLM